MQEIFAVHVPLWQLMLRGTLVYWFLFLVFRFVVRRDVGSIAIADVLVLVLIADASQNAMTGGYESWTEGAVLMSTIVGWNWLLDWASFRFAWVRRVTAPPPLLLVSRGRMLRHNLRKEFVSVDELMSLLRQQGIEQIGDVESARMEPDGQISVILVPQAEAAGHQGGGRSSSPYAR